VTERTLTFEMFCLLLGTGQTFSANSRKWDGKQTQCMWMVYSA